MSTFVLLFALLLLLGGGWLLFKSQDQRRATGLPAGEVIYADTGNWRRNDRPLFSRRYQLSGKPDYLVDDGTQTIPVEVKSTRLRGKEPYDSHKMQLAAYCLLVEETMQERPSYGILHYANATLRVPYTDELRSELLYTLNRMHQSLTAGDVPRSHNDAFRCKNCGFNDACEQRL